MELEKLDNKIPGQKKQSLIGTGVFSAETIQARIAIANNFPRDLVLIKKNMKIVFEDRRTAERGIYAVPRGGKTLRGLSIHAVREIVREYKHLSFGVLILSQTETAANCVAYAVDLANNNDEIRNFKAVFPPRVLNAKPEARGDEAYKFLYSQAIRRQRVCIETLIPDIIKNYAVDCINKTISKSLPPVNEAVKRKKRIDDMVKQFQALEKNLSKEMIFDKLEIEKEADFKEDDFVTMVGIYNAIKDGVVPLSKHFPAFKVPDFDEAEKKLEKADAKMSKEDKKTYYEKYGHLVKDKKPEKTEKPEVQEIKKNEKI